MIFCLAALILVVLKEKDCVPAFMMTIMRFDFCFGNRFPKKVTRSGDRANGWALVLAAARAIAYAGG